MEETPVSLIGIRNQSWLVYEFTLSASPLLCSCMENILPTLPSLWSQGMVLLKSLWFRQQTRINTTEVTNHPWNPRLAQPISLGLLGHTHSDTATEVWLTYGLYATIYFILMSECTLENAEHPSLALWPLAQNAIIKVTSSTKPILKTFLRRAADKTQKITCAFWTVQDGSSY